ncbi:hypothetical protein LNKW23_39680 [Paralimibaculum aggregatum]|uniref:Uncharacterized protein n=1 Tax=Paralimibaculum aggregatum TaxID=3036245 RepID=A0ABQ6LNG1_9RHOB|nr:hypothetical protein [Limibaculum sp. NKW23]GMG84752.1 hypothetical protein LNKW23_39680 [Limibaculum sp. NKW23]
MVVALPAMAGPGSSGTREDHLRICQEALAEQYGAVEFGEALDRRRRGNNWVRQHATTADGRKVYFRCQIRYGSLRGVKSYDGGDWVPAAEVPKPEPETPPEAAETGGAQQAEIDPAAGEDPPESAEALPEPEPDPQGAPLPEVNRPPEEGSAEAEGATTEESTEDSAGESAEGAADGAGPAPQAGAEGETDGAGEGDGGLGLAQPKRYRVGIGEGYAAAEGVTCHRKVQECYDTHGRIDPEVTAKEFP